LLSRLGRPRQTLLNPHVASGSTSPREVNTLSLLWGRLRQTLPLNPHVASRSTSPREMNTLSFRRRKPVVVSAWQTTTDPSTQPACRLSINVAQGDEHPKPASGNTGTDPSLNPHVASGSTSPREMNTLSLLRGIPGQTLLSTRMSPRDQRRPGR